MFLPDNKVRERRNVVQFLTFLNDFLKYFYEKFQRNFF